ncbi:hypothetical protein FHS96_004580 [Sphingomonas zeicaulis]|uniref:hypothetical protein n=1 Tax=Sphingomonas zeicaulis TaxID=1632740 RepID=UPI003D22A706
MINIIRWGFATLLFGIIILSFALHPLPLLRTDAPAVHHIEDLKPGTEFARLQFVMDYGGGVIMPVTGDPVSGKGGKPTLPSIGYSCREISILGRLQGYGAGLYSRGHNRIDFTPLNLDNLDVLLDAHLGLAGAGDRTRLGVVGMARC